MISAPQYGLRYVFPMERAQIAGYSLQDSCPFHLLADLTLRAYAKIIQIKRLSCTPLETVPTHLKSLLSHNAIIDAEMRSKELAKIKCSEVHFRSTASDERPTEFVRATEVVDMFA